VLSKKKKKTNTWQSTELASLISHCQLINELQVSFDEKHLSRWQYSSNQACKEMIRAQAENVYQQYL
jgi:hypothetical protein